VNEHALEMPPVELVAKGANHINRKDDLRCRSRQSASELPVGQQDLNSLSVVLQDRAELIVFDVLPAPVVEVPNVRVEGMACQSEDKDIAQGCP
jgi:hypothetical protein